MQSPSNPLPQNSDLQDPPELRRNAAEPKGVLQKNLKVLVYLGAALLVILAAVFSTAGKKTANGKTAASKDAPPQPMVQDNTDNNVQDLKNQLAAERLKEQQQAAMLHLIRLTPRSLTRHPRSRPRLQRMAQTVNPSHVFPGSRVHNHHMDSRTLRNLNCPQHSSKPSNSRLKSASWHTILASPPIWPMFIRLMRLRNHADRKAWRKWLSIGFRSELRRALLRRRPATSLRRGPQVNSNRRPADPPAAKHNPEVNIDSAVGQPYVIYEGLTMDTVLMNRLDGDAVGPVKVLVSNPVYSHDRQHVLIPEGTIVLGEARKIGSIGFGQQRRLAVVFHRMIMPDGYSVDLDQFHGLDQIGEEGLKDKVNNHYLEIFGTSIALGVIAGAAQITQGGGVYGGSGPQVFTNGAASSVSQSATTIMDRFMQIPPTITIREGHRVKVYFTQDMLLPAYENHTIAQTF